MSLSTDILPGESVKLFGRVIRQAGSPRLNTAVKLPASPCSDGSDSETWQPDQLRSVYWPGCQPPVHVPQAAIATAPASSLRSESVIAMQDAAATLSELGSCRSAPAAAPAQPVTTKPATSPARRRPSAGTSGQLPPNMKACSSCREVKAYGLFHACKAKRDGLQDRCKACRAELDRLRLAQARAAGGRLGGNKSPRKRALGRSQSESDSHTAAKRARGPAAAFKEWAALQYDAPPSRFQSAAAMGLPTVPQHTTVGVPADSWPAAAAPAAQAPTYMPDAHARRRYPQWQLGVQAMPQQQLPRGLPTVSPTRAKCSRASAPAAPASRRPAQATDQAWHLDADRRLGRIAAVLTSATGFCNTYGAEIHEFVALTGALLLAACVLRHGRTQQMVRNRQFAAQQQQWHKAAAAAAMLASHYQSPASLARPHFTHVRA